MPVCGWVALALLQGYHVLHPFPPAACGSGFYRSTTLYMLYTQGAFLSLCQPASNRWVTPRAAILTGCSGSLQSSRGHICHGCVELRVSGAEG